MNAWSERRAALIRRLATTLERGLPLPQALDAVADELPRRQRRALAAARGAAVEGAALPDVLERARLLEGHALDLLRATDQDPLRGLRLVADELTQRARLVDALRGALARPYRKFCVVLLLGFLALLALATTADHGLSVRADLYAIGDGQHALADYRLGVLAVGLVTLCVCWLPYLLLADATCRRLLRLLGRQLPWTGARLQREANATWLAALGQGLAAGDDLPRALKRAREALGDRPHAELLQGLERRAAEGASLVLCCEEATSLPPSTRFLIAEATRRADLPLELIELARAERERLCQDLWSERPGMLAAAEIVAALPVVGYFVLVLSYLDRAF